MNTRRPHRGWYFLIPVLALALAAGSVYWFTTSDDSPASTATAPRNSYRDIGAGVAVPWGVTENVRATVDGKATKPPFQQVERLGAVVHITPDGPLDSPMTLRFKLSRKVKPQDVVFAVNQTGKARDWQLVAPAKVDGEYAYVTTSHLSWWEPLWRSFADLVDNTLAELKRQFEGLTGDVFTEAEKPQCANEQRARDNGYSIAWKGAEVLHWCLGLEGDQPVVRIVNKRRYPIFVNHVGITVPNPPKTKLGVEWLARKSFSDSRTVLLPFDSIQLNYNLSNGQRRSFTTEYDGFAGSLNQLEFGVTTLINILTRFGAGGGTISNGAINITQFDRVTEAMSKALLIKDCANALNTDTPNTGAILRGCFSPSAIADMFGWKGVLLATVMIAGPVVAFFRGQFDTLGDLLQRKDQETVTVSYARPAPPIERHDDTIRFDGIGATSLATTAADLRARGFVDEGNSYEPTSPSCVSYRKNGQPLSFSVEPATGRVLAIRNESGNLRVSTEIGGLHIGSTLAQLRTAYANYTIHEFLGLDFGQGSNGVIVDGPGGSIGFSLADATPGEYATGRVTITFLNGVGVRGHAPTNTENGC